MSKRAQTSGNEDSPAKIPKPTSICEYCNKTFTSRGLSLHQRKCSKKLAHEKNEAKKTRAYKFCILNEYIHEEILSFLSNQTLTKMQMITGDHYEGCEPELAKICCKCENDNFNVGYSCRQCLSQTYAYTRRNLLRKKEAKIIYGMTEKDFKTLPYEERGSICLYERATLDKFVLNFSGSKKEWLRRVVKVRTQRKKAEVAKSRKKEFCDFRSNRVPLFDPGLPSVSARLAKTRVYMDLKTNDDQWYPRFNDVKDLCDGRNVCLPIVLGSTQCKDFILNGVGSAEEVVNGISAELNHASKLRAFKNTPSLMDVLRANGEEHLYDKIMELSAHVEENPPIIFGWQHVEEFVQAIEKAHALAGEPDSEPLPPSPFRLPAPVTVQSFKEGVLDFVRIPEAEARLETTCLPCTLAQSCDVGGRLRELDFDPWIRRVFDVEVVKAPIAFVYLPRAQSNTLERVMDHTGSLWGH